MVPICGIAGFNLTKTDDVDAVRLSRALLKRIQSRGRDATGAAWTDESGPTLRLSKAASPADVFTRTGLTAMRPDVRNAILHTRYATKGSPKVAANNHPIPYGDLVGVHNGVLLNDDELFAALADSPRKGQVDSEAIFAWLADSGWRAPAALNAVEGRAAVAWIDRRAARTLHVARVEGSPLVIGQTKAGGFVFASTADLLLGGCADAGVALDWSEEVPERTYLRVRDGVILDYLPVADDVKAAA